MDALCKVEVPLADGARVTAFVYAPEGVRDEPGTPFGVTYRPAPVVALHGNGESHEHLLKLIGPLAADRSVIAIDSRGHGQSARGSEPLSYELMAADTLEVISRLGVTQAHLVGFSDGGIVALLLARDHASRVLSLTTLGANLSPDGLDDEARRDMAGALEGLRQGDGVWYETSEHGQLSRCLSEYDASGSDPIACEAAGEQARYGEDELLALMLEQPHIDVASLAAIRCPACVMAGEHDLIKAEETHRIAAAIQDAELRVVPGCGHDLPLEAPEQVVEAACTTMRRAETQTGRTRPLVRWENGVPHTLEANPAITVLPATIEHEGAVLAMYERLLDACDEPGRETCGWLRGYWPLPNDVSARLHAGTTWIAVRSSDVLAEGSLRPGAPVLGAMSLDHDFGLPDVEPDWEPLSAYEALTCHLLATDPAARGQGVATALLAAYAREGIARGCRALRINTSPQSLSNRLYHELGFVLHKPVWFPYEGLPLTAWTNLYELRLDGSEA